MFKLKPGNVFQKLNTMDRKKAYTIGAVVIVCFVALLTLASMMGEADDTSFDGLNSRGYDLAQMPFVNDEAEKYLLAAKYPDMKENGSTLLYSAEEKEARQEADGAAGDEEETSTYQSSMSSDADDDSPTSRGYGGYRGGGRTATPTQVKQLGAANMQTGRGGSGIQSTYGAPRGDFSPYKDQNKGSEIPPQLKKDDARKALYQVARGSRAAAGLKDGKAGNAKRAMMGGNIQGSEAFTDKGVDLSKSGGLALDTNAPQESGDLSNLDKQVDDTARNASETNNNNNNNDSQWDNLLYMLAEAGINTLANGLTKLADAGIGAMTDKWGWTTGNSVWGLHNKNMIDAGYERCTRGSDGCSGAGWKLSSTGNSNSTNTKPKTNKSSSSTTNTRPPTGDGGGSEPDCYYGKHGPLCD